MATPPMVPIPLTEEDKKTFAKLIEAGYVVTRYQIGKNTRIECVLPTSNKRLQTQTT